MAELTPLVEAWIRYAEDNGAQSVFKADSGLRNQSWKSLKAPALKQQVSRDGRSRFRTRDILLVRQALYR
jgi:hypothetical protein